MIKSGDIKNRHRTLYGKENIISNKKYFENNYDMENFITEIYYCCNEASFTKDELRKRIMMRNLIKKSDSQHKIDEAERTIDIIFNPNKYSCTYNFSKEYLAEIIRYLIKCIKDNLK